MRSHDSMKIRVAPLRLTASIKPLSRPLKPPDRQLKHDDSKLPFSNNARHVYDDYVHFLMASKKPDDALRWADLQPRSHSG